MPTVCGLAPCVLSQRQTFACHPCGGNLSTRSPATPVMSLAFHAFTVNPVMSLAFQAFTVSPVMSLPSLHTFTGNSFAVTGVKRVHRRLLCCHCRFTRLPATPVISPPQRFASWRFLWCHFVTRLIPQLVPCVTKLPASPDSCFVLVHVPLTGHVRTHGSVFQSGNYNATI